MRVLSGTGKFLEMFQSLVFLFNKDQENDEKIPYIALDKSFRTSKI